MQKTTIHIYRQYLQHISDYFFPQLIIFKNSAVIHAKSFGETSNEFLNAVIVSTHINDLNRYFKKRLLDTTKPSITLQLTEAEIVVLYKVFFNLGIAREKTYDLLVRQDFINRLYEQLFIIASLTTVQRN